MLKEMGREQEALAILRKSRNYFESQLVENGNFWTYLNLSIIYAILDDKEEALKYLSKASEFGFRMGSHDIIEVYPPFENLRNDPKFKAIVKQAQDEKAAIREQIREAGEQGEIDL